MPRTILALGVLIILVFNTTPTLATTTESNYTVVNGYANVTPSVLTTLFQPLYTFNLSYAKITSLSTTRVRAEICQPGSYTPANSQTCSLCPPGKYSEILAAASSATCTACPAGKYSGKSGAGSASDCTLCPLDTYYAGTMATSKDNCTACPPFSGTDQPYGKTYCICKAGYFGSAGWCPSLTTPSHCLSLTSSLAGGPCSPCPAGFYCNNGRNMTCPLHSTSPDMSSSISQCLCVPGYFGDITNDLPLCQVCQPLMVT